MTFPPPSSPRSPPPFCPLSSCRPTPALVAASATSSPAPDAGAAAARRRNLLLGAARRTYILAKNAAAALLLARGTSFTTAAVADDVPPPPPRLATHGHQEIPVLELADPRTRTGTSRTNASSSTGTKKSPYQNWQGPVLELARRAQMPVLIRAQRDPRSRTGRAPY